MTGQEGDGVKLRLKHKIGNFFTHVAKAVYRASDAKGKASLREALDTAQSITDPTKASTDDAAKLFVLVVDGVKGVGRANGSVDRGVKFDFSEEQRQFMARTTKPMSDKIRGGSWVGFEYWPVDDKESLN